jgi:cytochrome P450
LYHLSQTAANAEQGVNPTSLIEHYTMTSILTIAYGNMWNFNPGDLHLHEAFSLTERAANSMSPSDQIREFFPFIQKVWPVKREKYIKLRDDFNKFYGVILREFKDKMTTDITSVQDCFVKEIIQTGELTDLQIMHFIGIFIGAGSDTTASVLKWLIVFLANFPGVQDKAFEDIKNTVGLHRLPSAEDGMYDNEPWISHLIWLCNRI